MSDDLAMFDVDQLVRDLQDAASESEARPAVKEVLTRALERPSEVGEALPPERAGITRIHVSPDLTVLKVIWAPGMRLYPHDHRMWAAIGIYGGREDNEFFRRTTNGLAPSGGKELTERDVALLGSETIHAVTNPARTHTGAIHVYGGDFFAQPRSEWDHDGTVERPFDVEGLLAHFEAANAGLE